MLDKLISLLRKIATTNRPAGVEVNYDGSEFSWKVKQKNTTAEEYIVGTDGTKKGP